MQILQPSVEHVYWRIGGAEEEEGGGGECWGREWGAEDKGEEKERLEEGTVMWW